jgi:hypothetical protein
MTSRVRTALLLVLLGWAPLPAATSAQETRVLIVSGLGGEPTYRELFVEWGRRLAKAAVAAGVDHDHVVFLAEDPTAAPGAIRAASSAEEVERAFEEIAATAGPQDRVLVVLIGHGSGSGEDSRVSLPGPSLRASDYERFLDRLAPRTVALVNLASASGDFVTTLAGEGRVVVAATRSSGQRNAPRFGEYFTEAFAGTGSDLDRDGRVSVLEAFEYARQETERYYRDRGLLVPETALIEDRTDGTGTHVPGEEEGVGQLAARFFLQGAEPRVEASDPAVAAQLRDLYIRQEALEVEVAALGQRGSALDPEAYQAALEPLLLELAQVGQEIRTLEGGGG